MRNGERGEERRGREGGRRACGRPTADPPGPLSIAPGASSAPPASASTRAHAREIEQRQPHTPPFFLFSDFLSSFLPTFRAANPQLDLAVTPRPGHHPYLRGEYRNGTSRTQCVRGMDGKSVAAVAQAMRDSVGRKTSVRLPARRHVPARRGPGGEAVGVQQQE